MFDVGKLYIFNPNMLPIQPKEIRKYNGQYVELIGTGYQANYNLEDYHIKFMDCKTAWVTEELLGFSKPREISVVDDLLIKDLF